jgi:hypothetical protein
VDVVYLNFGGSDLLGIAWLAGVNNSLKLADPIPGYKTIIIIEPKTSALG